ncbi:MAG: glycosyltransferase family 2 protein [Actinomycetota bacterium]
MTTTPRVSVIMPVLNESRRITACLDAIAGQQGAPPYELIVVDNGSRDGTPDLVRSHASRARLEVETERGPYAARNTGIAAALGEIVALTDADCVPDRRWLAEGVAAVDAGGDLVGGRVVQMASDDPTVWERYDRATYLDQQLYIRIEGFAATANLFVRSDVFRDVGVFVPRLTASGDNEFCRRATKAGYRLVYAPDARVRHHPRRTFRDTWALHRKLGMGFSELARYGVRPKPWRDGAMLLSLGKVVDQVAADGPPLRRRQLGPVHAVVLAARWVGRLTRRG